MTKDLDNNINEFENTNNAWDYSYCFYCPYYYRQLSPPPIMNNQKGAPPGPPPKTPPHKMEGPSVKSVSPGSIRPCVFRYVYIWLENGNSFWAWLTRVDARTASGFRWNQRRWVYFGVDLRRIESFECY